MKIISEIMNVDENPLIHKTKLKCIVNPILRKIQWFAEYPFVIVSHFDNGFFIGYGFKRMKLIKD